jgi:hypothetical protein
MEPNFSSAASVTTVTPELAAQIEAAIAALPPAHRLLPQEQEIVESKETALQRLQNWAFTEGFALVVESDRAESTYFSWRELLLILFITVITVLLQRLLRRQQQR